MPRIFIFGFAVQWCSFLLDMYVAVLSHVDAACNRSLVSPQPIGVQGQQTKERLPRDAALSLRVGFSTVTGGDGDTEHKAFASLIEAREACIPLAGRAARAATDRYESSVRLQALMSEVRTALHADAVESFTPVMPGSGHVGSYKSMLPRGPVLPPKVR